jgi:hypothetical protein
MTIEKRQSLRVLPEEFWNEWERDWQEDYRRYREKDKPPPRSVDTLGRDDGAGCPVPQA